MPSLEKNQSINKVVVKNLTYLDLTGDTVTSATLQKGITAHDNSGNKITGSLVVPKIQTSKTVTVTANGTTTISPDSGYSGIGKANVTVNVPSSGSNFEKVHIIVSNNCDHNYNISVEGVDPENPTNTTIITSKWDDSDDERGDFDFYVVKHSRVIFNSSKDLHVVGVYDDIYGHYYFNNASSDKYMYFTFNTISFADSTDEIYMTIEDT